jgi:signal transduction histidine kinase
MAAMSLRRRVTLSVGAVFVLLLLAVGFAIDATFVTITNRSEAAVLADHIQLARTLAAHDVSPETLADRMQTRSTEVSLVLADGQTLGQLPPSVAATNPRVRWITLNNPTGPLAGARMALLVNGGFLTNVQDQLRLTLLICAGVALLIVVLVVPLVVRGALVPLDQFTSLARRIAGGHRGDRLGPLPESTELGQMAGAFDEMLDDLEGAEARAVRSEASTRQFVSDAAHELRTPIAGISAAALAALDHSSDPETRERLLLLLSREAHRAGRLVDDLLDLARLDAGIPLTREDTDLNDLVTARADRLRVLHPDLSLVVTGAACVKGDPVRLGQVIDNLLNNACQAVAPHGRVSVSISTDAHLARVAVTDDGPGVPPEDRERIFDRMVRLDQSREARAQGAGLGLAIARAIAHAHGGDLVCEESVAGATFVLTVPTYGSAV